MARKRRLDNPWNLSVSKMVYERAKGYNVRIYFLGVQLARRFFGAEAHGGWRQSQDKARTWARYAHRILVREMVKVIRHEPNDLN